MPKIWSSEVPISCTSWCLPDFGSDIAIGIPWWSAINMALMCALRRQLALIRDVLRYSCRQGRCWRDLSCRDCVQKAILGFSATNRPCTTADTSQRLFYDSQKMRYVKAHLQAVLYSPMTPTESTPNYTFTLWHYWHFGTYYFLPSVFGCLIGALYIRTIRF